MPSEKFMKDVLSTPQAQMARGEALEPDETELTGAEEEEVQEVPETEEAEVEQPGEEQEEDDTPEPEGDLGEEPPDDEKGEAESEEEPVEHEEEQELIFGRYRSMEEAERGFEETRRFARERAAAEDKEKKRAEELERRVAELEGYVRGSSQGGDFEEWADGWIERNPEQGIREAIQASRETGDQSYAYAFTDRWAQSDPYSAGVWRNRLENAIFATQGAEEETPADDDVPNVTPANQVIASTWAELKEDYPEVSDPEFARGMAEVLRGNRRLITAAVSADPERVRDAFESARSLYKATHSASTPKRVRRSDVEQVEREKRAAVGTTGDGPAPGHRNATPQLTPEEENLLVGADRLGLRRRDE